MLNSGLRCLKIQPCTLNIHLSKTAACFFTLGGGCDLTAGGRRKPKLTRRQEELQKSARAGSGKVEKPLTLFFLYNVSTQTRSKTAAAVSTTAPVPCLSRRAPRHLTADRTHVRCSAAETETHRSRRGCCIHVHPRFASDLRASPLCAPPPRSFEHKSPPAPSAFRLRPPESLEKHQDP